MKTHDLTLTAMLVAITAALGVFPPITLPLIGVCITAQSLGVMLAGGTLGAFRGSLSILIFLIFIAIGFPLLPGGRGGFHVFLGPSGGFFIGWVFSAFAIGYMTERLWHRLNYTISFGICIAGGIVLMYSIGIPWVAFINKISLKVALIGCLPFLPGDVFKALVAAKVIMIVKRFYPIIEPK